jgi:hypothetical protein
MIGKVRAEMNEVQRKKRSGQEEKSRLRQSCRYRRLPPGGGRFEVTMRMKRAWSPQIRF